MVVAVVNTNFVTGNFAIAKVEEKADENDTFETKHGDILIMFEHLISRIVLGMYTHLHVKIKILQPISTKLEFWSVGPKTPFYT